jgi:5-methylcytosine-specific restriction endonuclease McrA
MAAVTVAKPAADEAVVRRLAYRRRLELFIELTTHYQELLAKLVAGLSCAYCADSAQTFDHVQARARKGPNTPENLVPVCRSCNASKSDRPLDEWAASLEKFVDQGQQNVERARRRAMRIRVLQRNADLPL